MKKDNSDLKFPDWLTDGVFDDLEKLGFDTEITWDSRGVITLHIWKLSEAEKRELEELQKWLEEEMPKLLEAMEP